MRHGFESEILNTEIVVVVKRRHEVLSKHPEYLDAKGLVALWRESLLAQKVLLGKIKG